MAQEINGGRYFPDIRRDKAGQFWENGVPLLERPHPNGDWRIPPVQSTDGSLGKVYRGSKKLLSISVKVVVVGVVLFFAAWAGIEVGKGEILSTNRVDECRN